MNSTASEGSLLKWIMPEQASTIAMNVDLVYWGLTAISAVFTIGIAIAIVVMAVKYRRLQEDQVGLPVHESKWIEITWTVVPLLISLCIFGVGTKVYLDFTSIPPDAMEIAVVGKQWMWKFQHPNGRREINELHVPIGRKIHLRMISQDVIHSMFVPAFRVKQDVLPMYYTSLWFEATKTGKFHLHCTEYCGKDHSVMGGHVYVMEPAAYEKWLVSGTGMDVTPKIAALAPVAVSTGSAAGRKLFEYLACASCHDASSSQRGPSLAGIWGTKVKLEGGSTVTFDDNYVRDSILNPGAKVVAGYQPVMPSFQGRVSEEDILELISYIKGLRGSK